MQEKEAKAKQMVEFGGPLLLMDVAKKLGVESYLAGAIISTLAGRGDIKQSFRKIGASPIYFSKGQEQRVRDMLFKGLNDLEKKALDRIRELKVAFQDDLYPQERYLMNDLKDFVSQIKVKDGDIELNCWRHYSVSDEEFEERVGSKIQGLKSLAEIPAETEKLKLPEPVEEIAEPVKDRPEAEDRGAPQAEPVLKEDIRKPVKSSRIDEFEHKVLSMLKEKNLDFSGRQVLEKNEVNYNSEIETSLGSQKVLLKILNRKRVTENELSRIYIEAMEKKTPFVVYIPKKITKKAEAFLEKKLGNIVSVVVI